MHLARSRDREADGAWGETVLVKEDTKNCLDCGYMLDGLPSNRCPECARTFDPTNPRTFAVNNSRGRPLRSGVAYLLVACAGAIGIIWFLTTYESRDNLYRPEWVETQRRIWRASQWSEFGVLLGGALLKRRNRYAWPFRAGMWIAGTTLGILWGYMILFAILWSI